MVERDLESLATAHLRSGLRVSVMSIGWTVSSSVVAVVVGLSAGSLVLVAFGLTGLLDAGGSATIVVEFRHALRYNSLAERHERLALRVVTGGLLAVGSLTAVESVRRLVGRTPSRVAPAGVALAALSVVVLAVLSRYKLQIAARIPSRALRADGWLTVTGCLLAGVTVAGTGLRSAFGWWWVDPVAAMGVATGAISLCAVMTRGEAVTRSVAAVPTHKTVDR